MGHNHGMGEIRELRERPWREWRFRGVVATGVGGAFAVFGVFFEGRAWWDGPAVVAIPCGLLCLVVALFRWSSERRRSARPEAGE